MTAVERLIKTAEAELGYLEKASNAQLDDKTANAGKNNWTKYARDLDGIGNIYNGKKNGFDWCDVFVDWCFIQTFGIDLAVKLLNQPLNGLGAGVKWSANYYQQKGRFFDENPKPGDQIFFGSGSSWWHTGIVVEVSGGKVHTIEGNTTTASGVIPNGGGVVKKSYSLTYRNIKGYGRPDYSIVSGETAKPKPTTAVKKEEKDMTYYKTINDVPAAYRDTVKKAIMKGVLKGTGNGVLDISEDLCRMLVILDRLGLLK